MTAIAGPDATAFRVRSPQAEGVSLCLFTADGEQRVPMARDGDDWTVQMPGNLAGAAYGFRASGTWAPDHGLWFDASKLTLHWRNTGPTRRR